MIDLSRAVWRKSSRSTGEGACVEVAHLGGTAAARDSKSPGPVLVFAAGAFRAFVRAVSG